MIESVAGAIVSAMPLAMSTMRHAIAPYDEDWSRPSDRKRPVAIEGEPARDDDLGADAFDDARRNGARTIIGTANARSRTPVSSGV